MAILVGAGLNDRQISGLDGNDLRTEARCFKRPRMRPDALRGEDRRAFAELARRNMELFQSAAGGRTAKKEAAPDTETKSELAELKAQLAALQQKLDKLGE